MPNYIRFWGVRGSYATPSGAQMRVGGNTPCVELRVDDHLLICDGGTGIIPLGNSLMAQQDIREVMIMFTHYHWDHITGLPFFVPAFVPGWKLNFVGPGTSKETVEHYISWQMRDPYFPVEVEVWLADINYVDPPNNYTLEYGSFKISTFNVHHPGLAFGYRIEVHDKVIIYVSDNELSFLDQFVENRQEEELDEIERQLMSEMRAEEHAKAVELFEGADILIHDAQYTPEDYVKKRGWGHSCYIETVNFAIDAHVKNLYLFHMDPSYDDDKVETLHRAALDIVAERKSTMQCHLAREGISIDIDTLK